MSDSGDPYSNNAITVSEQFQSFLTDYQSSINVTDEQRENMMKKNGRIVLPSEELKVDTILKESYLLQYAMKNPREYINLRNTEITKIKKDVDLEFLKLFDQFTTGPITISFIFLFLFNCCLIEEIYRSVCLFMQQKDNKILVLFINRFQKLNCNSFRPRLI